MVRVGVWMGGEDGEEKEKERKGEEREGEKEDRRSGASASRVW